MKSSNLINQSDDTIYLPQVPELRQRLKEKLKEYKKRIERGKKKYSIDKLGIIIDRDSNLIDSIYKSEIVETLLDKGKLNVAKLHDRLAKDFKGNISEDIFTNAIGVIEDYIKTGGARTQGGSGFFTNDMFMHLLGESGVLEFPDDAGDRAVLVGKYHEYVGRNLEYEQQSDTTVDRAAMKRNRYRMLILARLREKHRIFLQEVASEIAAESGREFDKLEFYNAVRQVRGLLGQNSEPGNSDDNTFH